MLYWAIVFFVISLIASLFGFTGIAIAFAGIAKILFFVFVVLFILTFNIRLAATTAVKGLSEKPSCRHN